MFCSVGEKTTFTSGAANTTRIKTEYVKVESKRNTPLRDVP